MGWVVLVSGDGVACVELSCLVGVGLPAWFWVWVVGVGDVWLLGVGEDEGASGGFLFGEPGCGEVEPDVGEL